MATPELRILYSEDDLDQRELISFVLAQAGIETVCPDTPQDFLRMARTERFDLYLLDSWIPDISGLELCKRIREVDSQTPIIFYSADAFPGRKEEALRAGAQGYITKPTAFDEIVRALRKACIKAKPATA
jgi:DNA-binding response OmpR family regulator